MAKPILLIHSRAPGDIVCMTACVRDLSLTYPREYEIHVAGSCSMLWEHNPHVAKFWGITPPRDLPTYRLSYLEGLKTSNRSKLHFLTAFHRDLETKLGRPVPVLLPKGDLHLSKWKRANRPIEERYWYLIAGGKSDITAKIWSRARFQDVVDALRSHGVRLVQDGAQHDGHFHPYLSGVLRVVGQTDLRDVLWWVYHCDGVICPVTFAMHVAAAFDKACIVIAGGREPWWWEAYTNSREPSFGPKCAPVRVPHRFFHTLGQLPCCRTDGCWRTQIAAIDGSGNESVCEDPVDDDHGQIIPACLKLITPTMIVNAVLDYYKLGVLDPVPGLASPPRRRSNQPVIHGQSAP
jgi:ADP-heptose:LPS heptosyltransferase